MSEGPDPTAGAVHVQRASSADAVPPDAQLQNWARAALDAAQPLRREVTLRLVDETEGAALNRRYRGKDYATNVLSFPFEPPPGVDTGLLGDIVICAPVVLHEAVEGNIAVEAHWAHMIVHGVLHLCGYDHERDADAAVMERLETEVLADLGFDDPYCDA